MGMREVLNEAEAIVPIDTINGMKIVPFDALPVLAQAAIINKDEVSGVTVNPDGTIARSQCMFAAINVDNWCANRYRQVKDKLLVVTDYRAIKDQSSGRVYAKQIPAFVFARKDGELALEKIETISDVDFVANYTKRLSNEAMQKLMPLLVNSGDIETADELPI